MRKGSRLILQVHISLKWTLFSIQCEDRSDML